MLRLAQSNLSLTSGMPGEPRLFSRHGWGCRAVSEPSQRASATMPFAGLGRVPKQAVLRAQARDRLDSNGTLILQPCVAACVGPRLTGDTPAR